AAVVLAILAVTAPLLAQAQESSIEVLETPEGPSSGELLPEEQQQDAAPSPCGTQPITVARMQWPSSALLTAVHARILTQQFGCEIRVQETDMATAGSSMGANGQPAIA